jgi:transposase
MRFYNKQHKYYCGIDLHARTMYLCIMNQEGDILFHRNRKTNSEAFLKTITPYREDIVVCVECIFTWYWLADLCAKENIPFVLGHALYMKAIHGGKSKNDRIDSRKIAVLLRGGTIPMAYVYPRKMRSTRDLLRRRMFFVHKRAELISHIQNTNSQYNLPQFGKKIAYKTNRIGIEKRFENLSVRKSVEADLAMLKAYDQVIADVELYIIHQVKIHNPNAYHLLKTIPGVGQILALVLLYEIEDINRFPRFQQFCSYARLIRPTKESAGKRCGVSNKKIGNHHLKWAFSEAVCLLLRESDEVEKRRQKLEQRHGKGKALGILSKKLGIAVYYMLKRGKAFDLSKYLNQ